jgi:hypothetical protein
MSYKVTRDTDGRPSLTLTGEPLYCQVLPADTGVGVWLVMAFAVWSAPDTAAVRVAIDAAKHFAGQVNLGLLPFDDPDELQAARFATAHDGRSPVWVLLRDGAVAMERTGVLTVDELVDVIGGQ